MLEGISAQGHRQGSHLLVDSVILVNVCWCWTHVLEFSFMPLLKSSGADFVGICNIDFKLVVFEMLSFVPQCAFLDHSNSLLSSNLNAWSIFLHSVALDISLLQSLRKLGSLFSCIYATVFILKCTYLYFRFWSADALLLSVKILRNMPYQSQLFYMHPLYPYALNLKMTFSYRV